MSDSHKNSESSQQPRWAIAADIGKRILVGVKYYDPAGNLTNQSQHVGEVIAVADNAITIRWENGQETTLPPQVTDAPQGVYRLRSSGREVVNPDLLATWRFDDPAAETREAEKGDGDETRSD